MASAIFAGSFDPPTLGHIDVITRGAALYERLWVAVGHNPTKRYLFTREERTELLREALASVPNVEVVHFDGLLVSAVKELGADVILRGIRSAADLELESRNGHANREIAGVESMFLLTDPRYGHVSSSLVRELAHFKGDFSRYVTPAIAAAVQARVASK